MRGETEEGKIKDNISPYFLPSLVRRRKLIPIFYPSLSVSPRRTSGIKERKIILSLYKTYKTS